MSDTPQEKMPPEEELVLCALWWREEDDAYKVAKPRFNLYSRDSDSLFVDVTEDSNHVTRYLARQMAASQQPVGEDELKRVKRLLQNHFSEMAYGDYDGAATALTQNQTQQPVGEDALMRDAMSKLYIAAAHLVSGTRFASTSPEDHPRKAPRWVWRLLEKDAATRFDLAHEVIQAVNWIQNALTQNPLQSQREENEKLKSVVQSDAKMMKSLIEDINALRNQVGVLREGIASCPVNHTASTQDRINWRRELLINVDAAALPPLTDTRGT